MRIVEEKQVRPIAYKDGEDSRTYELSNIPLDKYQFQLKFKKTPLPVVVKIQSVLGKLIDEAEDGQVTIYGGYAGATSYWTYTVNKLIKSETPRLLQVLNIKCLEKALNMA